MGLAKRGYTLCDDQHNRVPDSSGWDHHCAKAPGVNNAMLSVCTRTPETGSEARTQWPAITTWPAQLQDAEVERTKREGARAGLAGVPVESIECVLGIVARNRNLSLRELVHRAVRLSPPPRATHPAGCPRVPSSPPPAPPPQLLGTTCCVPPLQSPLPPESSLLLQADPPHPRCLRPLERCGQRSSPSQRVGTEPLEQSLSLPPWGGDKEQLLRGFHTSA